MKKLLFTLGFALMAVVLQAQTWEDRSCGLHIYYKLDKADIDMEYRNNRSSIDSLANMLKRMMVESPHRNLVLNVTSYASLEASYAYNEKLTARRTEALLACLKEKVAGLPDTVQIQNNVFDWNTLKVRVNDVENMPYRAEVMEVLLADREGSQAEQESRRKADLQRLGGGEAYRFINRRLGAEMRQSCMNLACFSALR